MGEEGCPFIKLSAEEKRSIREPSRKSIIIRIMGRKIGYTYLSKRLHMLWRIQGDLRLVDSGNGFFLAKFSDQDDHEFALFGGPWIVADH